VKALTLFVLSLRKDSGLRPSVGVHTHGTGAVPGPGSCRVFSGRESLWGHSYEVSSFTRYVVWLWNPRGLAVTPTCNSRPDIGAGELLAPSPKATGSEVI
jgi:hypothetical protein